MHDTAINQRQSYLDAPHGLAAWLLTRDHKRIAMLHLISITIMFALGGLFATMVRIELLTPRGDVLSSDLYNKAFSLHGIIMVFFFLVPSVPATLGNFLMPIMCGAKDLAFPRINLISWYLYVIGGLIALGVIASGGVDTGWTFYTPYSTVGSQTGRHGGGARRVHCRVLVHPHRLQLHRHGAPDARAGPDLVPAAALRVGELRDEPRHDPRHAGRGHHGPARWASSGSLGLASSIRGWAATRCSSSTSSGSTRTRPSTS